MQTENAFMSVLPKIKCRNRLDREDFARLCIFTATMYARTNVMGRHFKNFFRDIHELVVKGERAHNARPVTSLETKDMAEHAHQRTIQATLQTLPQMLFRMSLAILETDDRLGFITSDTPCIWFDPDAYKLPPGLRNPNLGNPRIEISLPVTPQHALLFTHSKLRGYMRSAPQTVNELNRRVRFGCAESFISKTGETNPFWFHEGVIPDDAWENTEEGKHALQQAQRHRDAREKWKKEHQAEATNTKAKTAGE